MTDAMFARAKTLVEYRISDLPEVDLAEPKRHDFDGFTVDVVDSGTSRTKVRGFVLLAALGHTHLLDHSTDFHIAFHASLPST